LELYIGVEELFPGLLESGRPAFLSAFDPEAWDAMNGAERLQWLTERGLLVRQGPGADGADLWAWGAPSLGSHPVSALCQRGDIDGALQALALGATPFGGGQAKRSPLGWALRALAEGGDSALVARSMLGPLWERARQVLDSGVDPQVASYALGALALEACSAGSCSLARSCGLPLGAAWLSCFDDERHPWARPFLTRSASPNDLEFLRLDGLDLASPLRPLDDGVGPQSLWLWLADDLPDGAARAACLLRAGNDPRIPLDEGAPSPLQSLLDNGCAEALLPQIHALLLCADESVLLREALATPSEFCAPCRL
jgi:hypothetical protein